MRRAVLLCGAGIALAIADDAAPAHAPPDVHSTEIGCLYPVPDQPGRLYRAWTHEDVAAAVRNAVALVDGCGDVLVVEPMPTALYTTTRDVLCQALRNAGHDPLLITGHPADDADAPAGASKVEALAARYLATVRALDPDTRAALTDGHRLALPRRAPKERAPREPRPDVPDGPWSRAKQPPSAAADTSGRVHEVTLGVDPGSAWVGVVALRGAPAEAVLQRTYEVGERVPLARPKQVGTHVHTHRRSIEQHHVDALAAAVVAHAAEVGATRAVVEQIDAVHFRADVDPTVAASMATALLRTTWIATTIAAALRAAGLEVHGVTQASARASVVGRAPGKRGGSSPELIPSAVAAQVTGWDPRADEHALDAAVYALWGMRQGEAGVRRRAPRKPKVSAQERRRAAGCTCGSTRRHRTECGIFAVRDQEAGL